MLGKILREGQENRRRGGFPRSGEGEKDYDLELGFRNFDLKLHFGILWGRQ